MPDPQTIVAPSMLSANFGALDKDVEMVNQSQADWFHIDVMDGMFVPNISFGFPVIEAIKAKARKPLDVHLMIAQPERYVGQFRDAGADILTVHYEACTHLHRTLQQIREAGMKAGVAVNPHTSVQLLTDILPEADLVLIMSVNPGFGGQYFIDNALNKIELLDELRKLTRSDAVIEVDGGVGTQNAWQLARAGARALVAGSAVFKSASPQETIAALKHPQKITKKV